MTGAVAVAGVAELDDSRLSVDWDDDGCGWVAVVDLGNVLLILVSSSTHLHTAPETPSSTLSRSSIASLVNLSSLPNCSSVNVGGSSLNGVGC